VVLCRIRVSGGFKTIEAKGNNGNCSHKL
jgi:hypothetical protein